MPAVALGVDVVDKSVMIGKRKEEGMWTRIVLEGFMIGALALLAFAIGNFIGDIRTGRTMCFCVLSISQLVHAFNMRTIKSLLDINIFENVYLIGALILGVFLQWLVVEPNFMNSIFGTVPLNGVQWLVVAILSFVPVLVCEIEKRVGGSED